MTNFKHSSDCDCSNPDKPPFLDACCKYNEAYQLGLTQNDLELGRWIQKFLVEFDRALAWEDYVAKVMNPRLEAMRRLLNSAPNCMFAPYNMPHYLMPAYVEWFTKVQAFLADI